MLTADRYNYIKIGTTPFTIQVKETYAYAGIGGAVSSRATQIYVNGGAQEAFTQAWTWNDLGEEATLTYPRCTHTGCNGGALTSRSVSFGYTKGFLTSVPSYATSIAYHPNGMVKNVVHANGVTWNQAADPNGMARPSSYSTSGATSNNWTSGSLRLRRRRQRHRHRRLDLHLRRRLAPDRLERQDRRRGGHRHHGDAGGHL